VYDHEQVLSQLQGENGCKPQSQTADLNCFRDFNVLIVFCFLRNQAKITALANIGLFSVNDATTGLGVELARHKKEK